MNQAAADSRNVTILMLANDLSDAAIHKRVRMLQAGDAKIFIAGFRRSARPVSEVAGCPATDMGETRNGSYLHRIGMILRALFILKRHVALFDVDIVIARNLETLAIAVFGLRFSKRKPVVVYEVLDLHRLVLGRGIIGFVMRYLERLLMGEVQAVLTSAPAYIENYFHRMNPTKLPIRLVENKLWQPPLPIPDLPTVGEPWVIGWFGILRCRRSLHALADFVRNHSGQVKVIIRGRPALDQIPEFHGVIAATPGLHFEGAYKHPDDLAAMYGAVHFSWAIDMYEEGLNSAWHLPNRLYEGGYYHAVPIYIEGVEAGNYLAGLGIGVPLRHPLSRALDFFLSSLSAERYCVLSAAAKAISSTQWVFDDAECKDLVRFMAGLKRA